MTDAHPKRPTDVSQLKKWNLAGFVLHFASAMGLILIANDFALPVNASWADGPPGMSDIWPRETLFSIPLAWGAFAFAALSALFHLLISTVSWNKYASDLTEHGINQFRWIEYSISSSLMIVLISQVLAIFDLAALVAIFTVNLAMILFGWQMELHNRDRRELGKDPAMSAFWMGSLVGIVPWVIFLFYLMGSATVPGFVWGIVLSLFVFFNSFAVVQWLEYSGKTSIISTVVGAEKSYIVLSFVAKTALTWQVAANILID